MKRPRKEGKEEMKEENKGSQLIGSSCTSFLVSKIEISITGTDRRKKNAE
jgi:hypothetical protein